MKLFRKLDLYRFSAANTHRTNHASGVLLAASVSLALVVSGGVAASANDGPAKPDVPILENIPIDEDPFGDDYGEYYLESIGADPNATLEVVGYDEELGTEIFNSPLGEFYVDAETVESVVDSDPLGIDPIVVPGLGEVEYIVTDIRFEDLSAEALDEFASAGVDAEALFSQDDPVQRGVAPLPGGGLVQSAGVCEVGLGENVIERLEECARVGGVEAPPSDAIEDEPADEAISRAVSASPPSGCAYASTVKFISRTSGCVSNTRRVSLVNRVGRLIGSITVVGVAHVSTRTDNTTQFNNTAYVRVSSRSGAASGRVFNFKGKPICGFNCMSPSGSDTFSASTSWKSVTGTVRGDIGGGQARLVNSAWQFSITSPGIAFAGGFNTLAVQPRCDNGTPQLSGRGCVFPNVVPVFKLPRYGAASGVANHVQKAINSGLPSNLTRANSATIPANRLKACPSSLKRDTGYQCDEYPFASSNQGGASGGSARVFSGCRWPATTGSGARGFSRCQVQSGQNAAGGKALGSFYRSSRVMVNDKYKVQVS